MNKSKWEGIEPMPWQDEIAHMFTAESLASMDQPTYERLIHPRFWYIPVERLDRWHANAARSLKRGFENESKDK